MIGYRDSRGLASGIFQASGTRVLAAVLTVVLVGYIAWKIGQSGDQALQFAFNGLSVGAVYALVAMGFTLVYSTVWFFDLYYGAAAALGAYGVFYLRSSDALYTRFDVNNIFVNIVFAAVVAGVVAWVLHVSVRPRLRGRINSAVLRAGGALLAGGAGVYTGFVLSYPDKLNVMLSPAVGVLAAIAAGWAIYQGCRRALPGAGPCAVSRRSRPSRGPSRGSRMRLPGVQRPRLQSLPELGCVVPAGGVRGPGPVPGAVRVHAPTVEVAADNARGLPGHPPGADRLHLHSLRKRAPSLCRLPSGATPGPWRGRSSRGSTSSP